MCGGRCVGEVEIGKGDRAVISEGGPLSDVASDINNGNHRRIVTAGDVDGDILGVGAAVVIGEGVGVDLGQALTDRQRLDGRIGIIDGIAVTTIGID